MGSSLQTANELLITHRSALHRPAYRPYPCFFAVHGHSAFVNVFMLAAGHCGRSGDLDSRLCVLDPGHQCLYSALGPVGHRPQHRCLHLPCWQTTPIWNLSSLLFRQQSACILQKLLVVLQYLLQVDQGLDSPSPECLTVQAQPQ